MGAMLENTHFISFQKHLSETKVIFIALATSLSERLLVHLDPFTTLSLWIGTGGRIEKIYHHRSF